LLASVNSMSERAAWKSFQPHLYRVTAKLPPKSAVALNQFVEEWRINVAVNLKGGFLKRMFLSPPTLCRCRTCLNR
jgi:hypothetical protein